MNKVNSGKYRICKHQIGIGGTIEVLENFTSKEEAFNRLSIIDKESNWDYYCEEEVFYQGTQLNEERNPIDSTLSWIRLSQ